MQHWLHVAPHTTPATHPTIATPAPRALPSPCYKLFVPSISLPCFAVSFPPCCHAPCAVGPALPPHSRPTSLQRPPSPPSRPTHLVVRQEYVPASPRARRPCEGWRRQAVHHRHEAGQVHGGAALSGFGPTPRGPLLSPGVAPPPPPPRGGGGGGRGRWELKRWERREGLAAGWAKKRSPS